MAARSPYQTIEVIMAELAKQAEQGNWENAASIAAQLNKQIQQGGLPAARSGDKAALEASLSHITNISERATPLRDDIARLLKAFGPAPSP